MARADRPREEENFYRDVDRFRVTGGSSCAVLVGILLVVYFLGAILLWYWLK